MFRFVWRDGKLPQDADDWSSLIRQLDVPDANELIRSDRVKQVLRENTDRAVDLGLFGVPTMLVDGEMFWGVDYFDFLLDYLNNPGLLDDDEMQRVSNLPAAFSEKTKIARMQQLPGLLIEIGAGRASYMQERHLRRD